jgi:PAS domain S-box-containing protein
MDGHPSGGDTGGQNPAYRPTRLGALSRKRERAHPLSLFFSLYVCTKAAECPILCLANQVQKGHPLFSSFPIRVLICDDTENIRSLIKLTFDFEPGIEVVGEAENGMRAIFEAGRLQPDVILLDLAMPVMDGLQALPEIRRVAPDSNVIVFSGFEQGSVAGRAGSLGAASYLQKGASPKAIIDAVREAAPTTHGEPADVLSDIEIFERVFGEASLGIAIGDIEGRPLFANSTFESMLGYGPGELQGKDMRQYTHPDDLEMNIKLFQELMDGERDSYTYRKRYIGKDGSFIEARVIASLLRQGDTTYVLGAVASLEHEASEPKL